MEIARTGARTLLIKARMGNILSVHAARREFRPNFAYFYHRFSSPFRPVDMPFGVGAQVPLSDRSVKVIDVDNDGRPKQVSCEFSVPVENPTLCWLQWHRKRYGSGHYLIFDIPAVGDTTFTEGPFGAF